jgi:hypothetical protein
MRGAEDVMKLKLYKCALVICLLSIGSEGGFSQAFTNLGFESANVPNLNPPDQSAYLAFSNALPGWSGSWGTTPATQVLYNDEATGSVEIDLIGRNTDFLSNDVIAGKFMVLLQAGEANGTSVPASIAQTGLVPAGSLSLRFAANVDLPDFAVTFNGLSLPILQLTPGPNLYQTQEYGCDISAYAGKVGELQFSAEPNDDPFAAAYFDSIIFSTLPVPEPGTVALFGAGAALLGLRRNRKPLP